MAQPSRYKVSNEQAPKYKILGGQGVAQLFLNGRTGSKEAAISTLDIHPGTQVKRHRHETSSEYLYVLSGNASMTLFEGKIEMTFKIKEGDAVYIPKNTWHKAEVENGSPIFKAVQIYVGAGPEQRFTQTN